MSGASQRVAACAEEIKRRTEKVPEVGLVLGSGLGSLADRIEDEVSVPYEELSEFPTSTVEGHRGRFLLGKLAGKTVVCMDGRVHYYEGYPMEDVVLPIRVMGRLGAKKLLLTNAAGGIAESLRTGGLMLLTDHIASFVPSPLRGPNEEAFGPRFPDMTEVYSPRLRALARDTAAELGIPLGEGVYLQLPGPQYETPAEIRLYKKLGADAVGMSTACEAIAARHLGMEVCGISCITNPAAGLGDGLLDHEDVQRRARELGTDFSSLVLGLLERL